MNAKWKYLIQESTKQVWFPTVCYGVFGVIAALLGVGLKDFIPDGATIKIGADSVGRILNIMASTMLTVATFTLGTMVAAYGNASNAATPRVTKLLLEDQTAQRALATFIGAFLYSIVGIISLATDTYGRPGRFILFISTIFVIFVVVVSLLKTVARLSTLGLMDESISRVESAARSAMSQRFELQEKTKPRNLFPNEGFAVKAKQVGYVVRIDLNKMEECCKENNIKVALEVLPGSFVFKGQKILTLNEVAQEEVVESLSNTIVIEPQRTFEEDPRFGLIVLSEIACRALSPGINDPGTAIAVINSGVRLLTHWSELQQSYEQPKEVSDRVFLKRIEVKDFFEDFFSPIERDGGGMLEVVLRLQKALKGLADFDSALFKQNAEVQFQRSQLLSKTKLEIDQKRVQGAWDSIDKLV